jgi:hypothetical protein
MRRLNDEGGAVAVIMAIAVLGLVGMGALVVDVGQMYYEVRELQNGADAAALAVAQDCAGGNCGAYAATATQFTNANANDGSSDAVVQLPGLDGANSVTVTASTRSATGDDFLTHRLANVLGIPTSTFSRQATAIWGYVGGGPTIPLTFSECEWDLMTGGLGAAALPTAVQTVVHHTGSGANECSGPAGQDYPGGFGWLDTDGSGSCQAQVVMGEVGGDTGSGSPTPAASTGCTDAFFASLIGETVLMPIYTTIQGTGSNATFTIVGFGALEVTGYRVGGGPAQTGGSPVPCGNPDRCIAGRFVAYYDLGSQPAAGAPNYGATTVGLSR